MILLLQLLANGLVNAGIYALLAIGFGIVNRTTRIFHITYGGFYTLSAYFLYTFLRILKLPLFVCIPLVLIILSILGILMEKGVYRPLYKRSAGSGVFLIASLGIYIIIENLIALIFGNEVKILSKGIEPSYSLAGVVLTRIQIIQFIVSLVLIITFYIFVKRVKIIKALWAMGDEPELLRALGLPLFKLRELVFIISSVFVGVASMLTALDVGMDPHVGLSTLLTAAVAVIVGGIDSYLGWIAGSFILAELQSLVIWRTSARWAPLVTFVLLIFILLTRPQGVLGTKKRLEEI
ncbi:MAG: branched-chain amino acid ABC transporter permease [Candidatus Cloacimonas sp. 4484_209]|nr:MAG: branched-chain amino acid ABC transporter permease [Candidatus Cloacimonas sp. 4484_209]